MTYDASAANHNRRWKSGVQYMSSDEAARLCATRRWGFGTQFAGRFHKNGVFDESASPHEEYEGIAKWPFKLQHLSDRVISDMMVASARQEMAPTPSAREKDTWKEHDQYQIQI
eukprot:8142810-Karenia_brevis.AAC.1